MYDLTCEFDIQKHKQTYVNYFEVVILPTGKVEYAVPSHQEKLISIGMKKFNCTREEFEKMCPEQYFIDYMTWLTNVTGCITVSNDYVFGKPNKFQMHKLKMLKREGLTNYEQIFY